MAKFYKNYVALDLELNQPSKKIIQIGLAFGSAVIDDPIVSWRAFVNPNEKLDSFIIKLCDISQDQVDNGMSLSTAFWDMKSWLDQQSLEWGSAFMNPLTWGGGDTVDLQNQLGIEFEHAWPFGHRWLDVKTIWSAFKIAKNEPPIGGLSKAVNASGMKFVGRKHQADNDAINTLRMFRHLVDKLKTPVIK